MTQVHTTYKSEFSIKTSLLLDNFTEFRKLDIFDSKLAVWEDYLVGIQLLLTGKISKLNVNVMQNDIKNFQMLIAIIDFFFKVNVKKYRVF